MKTKRTDSLNSTADLLIENNKLKMENRILKDLLNYHSVKIPKEIEQYISCECDLGLNGIAELASEINSLKCSVMMLNEFIVNVMGNEMAKEKFN